MAAMSRAIRAFQLSGSGVGCPLDARCRIRWVPRPMVCHSDTGATVSSDGSMKPDSLPSTTSAARLPVALLRDSATIAAIDSSWRAAMNASSSHASEPATTRRQQARAQEKEQYDTFASTGFSRNKYVITLRAVGSGFLVARPVAPGAPASRAEPKSTVCGLGRFLSARVRARWLPDPAASSPSPWIRSRLRQGAVRWGVPDRD